MALNNLGLGFVFTARDLASAKMQRLEHRFTSLDERVTGGTNHMTTAFRREDPQEANRGCDRAARGRWHHGDRSRLL